MISALLAAAFTFTASATGVSKGTPVEFLFIGNDSDRDYEAMFTLDMPIADFVNAVEKAGLKPGQPLDTCKCQVWPVGIPVKFKPDVFSFIEIDDAGGGFDFGRFVYTGGLRNTNGVLTAALEMPASVCSLYSLGQSIILPEMIFEQGDVYGKFHARESLRKGEKHAFTILWNDADSPRHIDIHVKPGESAMYLERLKTEAKSAILDVMVSFDETMTVKESIQFAKALEIIDSVCIKITGCRPGSLFFRAFLPLVKWTDRQNRMVQPFELTICEETEKLVYIDEDWTVEGTDPKLTPTEISFSEAFKKQQTDTCFIFALPDTKLSRIYSAMRKLQGSNVRNWYVFSITRP